ncbi:MAG: alpha-galactosidase [Vallitaleaceae bacterium]|jgi:alpha-galactosidase|nr:alpha-galactosidase [Vallitaleaceae bacterium]
MAIIFEEDSREFHIYNGEISYIIQILENQTLGNLYFGKRIQHKCDFGYLLQGGHRPLAVYNKINEYFLSPQYTKLEFPTYGTGDFRYPMISVTQKNGSKITNFEYDSHDIFKGKKKLLGLPATYVESEDEATTLEIVMVDPVLSLKCILSYTIFEWCPAITRSILVENHGNEEVVIDRLLSASVDLPDSNYELITLSGAWARERHVKRRKIEQGIQGVYSMRGTSSSEHNPFLAIARKETTEMQGEVYGFSLVYSGNHLEQVEVDTHDMTRISIGIHPDTFEWALSPEESFQTPEAVLVYSDSGLNKMSQIYHKLYRTRLVRGVWREKERPILINNWEVTEMNFTEDHILRMATIAKELGVELFVLDDGWFGNRNDDKTSLGDWYVQNFNKLPNNISGLSKKIEKIGLKFGIWIEPEMVNMDSDLYRLHPDWIISVPNRMPSPSRNQYILDFTRSEVVDYIFELLDGVFTEANVSYVKWDMNRYMTECYSASAVPRDQGKVFHKYVLGVYDLYERLISKHPSILFESCSSGGARFDPGILFYAPQTWTSDNTDAIERLKIQYGTSFVYPLSSMGAHISRSPNLQMGRTTPIETRGNVAIFGAFGFELDLSLLNTSEIEIIRDQIKKVKQHRKLIINGTFYRLESPFTDDRASWIVVSEDRTKALAGYYQILKMSNGYYKRLALQGLDPKKQYSVNGNSDRCFYGDELMYVGLLFDEKDLCESGGDFTSELFYFEQIES